MEKITLTLTLQEMNLLKQLIEQLMMNNGFSIYAKLSKAVEDSQKAETETETESKLVELNTQQNDTNA